MTKGKFSFHKAIEKMKERKANQSGVAIRNIVPMNQIATVHPSNFNPKIAPTENIQMNKFHNNIGNTKTSKYGNLLRGLSTDREKQKWEQMLKIKYRTEEPDENKPDYSGAIQQYNAGNTRLPDYSQTIQKYNPNTSNVAINRNTDKSNYSNYLNAQMSKSNSNGFVNKNSGNPMGLLKLKPNDMGNITGPNKPHYKNIEGNANGFYGVSGNDLIKEAKSGIGSVASFLERNPLIGGLGAATASAWVLAKTYRGEKLVSYDTHAGWSGTLGYLGAMFGFNTGGTSNFNF
tara:strand:+ start:4024 stop:4890 length:867 start_codon:yes stop_codon:yes gene_type:complete